MAVATLDDLERLAKQVVGHEIPVKRGQGAYTDGGSITVIDPQALWPTLSEYAHKSIDRFLTGHEAGHIAVFEKEARKRGALSMSAEDFYQAFADPVSPTLDSQDYVRFLLNVVEDRLVDNISASHVGEKARVETNRFFVWNRQGARRPSLAEFEAQGPSGRCAAFIEAMFQVEIYHDLVESFYSQPLRTAAQEAVKAIDLYGQGAVSRTQALQRVIAALKKYCPLPWSLPPQYQPPRGQTLPQSGGEGESKDESEGQKPEKEKGEQESQGSPTERCGNEDRTPMGEDTRKDSPIQPSEKREDDLNALLRMLERVLVERSKESGRGRPEWRMWSPGDQISSPDEISRYWEDEGFGIDPLKRRAVRIRQKKKHLLAVFIDSSGSVEDALFAQLYQVCAQLAERIVSIEGCYLGVGQFSGGAEWVLEPTRNADAIREFASEHASRMFWGGTVVGEIYHLLPAYFAEYQAADLIVLTDGYIEDGKQLARSLQEAQRDTGCAIKLHGVVFRGSDGTIRGFEKAKNELPQFVRIWHIGRGERK